MYLIRSQMARRRRNFVPSPDTNGQILGRCLFKSPYTNAAISGGMFESPDTGHWSRRSPTVDKTSRRAYESQLRDFRDIS
ncbi:hypothetical protein GALMADRAFT_1302171 [Galerina marginata CBS 339.88]|uniref:Uncharacterized protein n=1 Tax=Galerina marginata (strain CBS 339.88) TaxID=685588 RepID=A0A067T4Q9_GALM3|nr:hypothetical protein GALMADRAFT_1302171 [Galerina marginata CBS 339.88]